MASDHDVLRTWTAAYVLGALSPQDRSELESHAATCEECRADMAALAPLPSLLARLGPDDLVSGGEASLGEAISGRARRELGRLRVSRRRWRLAAVAGMAAAVVVALLAWIVGPGGDGGGRSGEDLAGWPSGWENAPVELSGATDATLGTVAKGWGTEIHLAASGLPARDGYRLWAVDDSGTWHLAATWGPTQGGNVRLTGATAVPVDSLDRLYVTSPVRDDVLVEASASAGTRAS